MKRFLTFLYLVCLHSSVSTAAVIIDMYESDGNVVAEASGTINTMGLTPTERVSTVNYEGLFRGGLNFVQPGVVGPLDGAIFVGNGGGSIDEYILETTLSFTTGVLWTSQGDTGNHVGIISRSDMGDSITVPKGYTSGDPISGSSSWPGATLSAMKAIPGTYIFSWGSGGTADSLTLNIESPPVGESFTGTLPSGASGTLGFTTSDPGCAFVNDPKFLPEGSVTLAPPDMQSTVDGVGEFTIDGCAEGATINVSMDYGFVLPADTEYWNVGDPWLKVDSTLTGSVIKFSVTDGGPGDGDGIVNAQIVNSGGALIADIFTDDFEAE